MGRLTPIVFATMLLATPSSSIRRAIANFSGVMMGGRPLVVGVTA